MKIMSIKRVSFCIAIFIAVTLILLALFWRGLIFEASGQALFPPFEGGITRVSYECCFGHLITVTDTTTGLSTEIMYYPFISDLNQYYQVFFPGPTTVGDYFPLGICLDAGSDCAPTWTAGTIRQVGTDSILGI